MSPHKPRFSEGTDSKVQLVIKAYMSQGLLGTVVSLVKKPLLGRGWFSKCSPADSMVLKGAEG